MNYPIVFKNIGYVLQFESLFLLLPLLVSLIYGESIWPVWLITSVAVFGCGFLLSRLKPRRTSLSIRDGNIIVGLSWIAMAVVGAVPFTMAGDIPSYSDALFETISGFTTTGSSILNDIEALHHSSLFWRSFTHWIGGMGVIVFILVFLPMTGSSSIHLLQAESPGHSVERIVPKLKNTVRSLYIVYFLLTGMEFISLTFAGMPLFDTICTTFGTVGTGGFSILNSSAADYTTLQQSIITLFMILSAVNFAVYIAILGRKPRDVLRNEEVRLYLAILVVATAVVTITLLGVNSTGTRFYDGVGEAAHEALFQTSSVMTTTGFGTADFDRWPALSQSILVMLMLIGACSGSTGGGIKVSRLLILIKDIRKRLASIYHPHEIYKIRINGKSLRPEVVQNVYAYISFYIVLMGVSTVLISVDGFDYTTNFTAVLSAINNIGPGLSAVGPTQNFSGFSVFSKMILAIDMLFGRLELFPMLILFHPDSWKRK